MNPRLFFAAVVMFVLTGMTGRPAQPAPADTAAAADPTAALAQRLDQLNRKLSERMQAIEEAVKQLQARLGDSFQRPTVFNTIERRLEEIEKRLDKLERDLDRLDDRVNRLERGR